MHPKLLEHFQNPRHAGPMQAADATVEVSNPVCGDILKLWLKVVDGRVSAASFQCRGCVASIACGSALTELVTGMALADAPDVTRQAVEEAVGELAAASKHAAVLAVDAWRKAVQTLTD